MTYYRMFDSPIGPLTLAGRGSTLTHLRMVDQTHEPNRADWIRDDRILPGVVDQLEAYFAGELTDFDLPLDLQGSDFQLKVWEALRRIPYGRVRTYADIAKAIGDPKATRAVGGANHVNPVPIIVPCHRVVAANGKLGGFACGTDYKRWLLDVEQMAATI